VLGLDTHDIRNFLFELVSIDSHNYEEFAVKYVRDVIEELGNYSVEIQNVIGKSFNLIVNPIKRPDFVIATHIDTIPLKCEAKIISETKVSGTGVVDAKGSIASIVYALSELKEIPEKLSIAILAGEEKDSGGCSKYLETFSPKRALVLEPSNLDLYFGSIGYLEMKVSISGYARHPDFIVSQSDSLERENPVEIFFKWVSKLRKKCEKMNCKVVPLHISTDGDIFTTPSKLDAEFNITINEGINVRDIMGTLEDLHEKNVFVSFEDASNPFKTNDKDFVEFLTRIYSETFNKNPSTSLYPAWTDATLFYERGIPVAIFGPGDYGLAHTVDEEIDIRDVVKAGLFLINLIKKHF